MKKHVICLAFLIAVAGLLVAPQAALAQSQDFQPGGGTQIDRLQARCDTITSSLRRLYSNDTLLRVNVGQNYNDISARLMAKLNARLAVNRIDSSRVAEITSRFEAARATFATEFNHYEGALSALIRTDCRTNPTEFYAHILQTRDTRAKLATAVQQLNDIVVEYRAAVEHIHQKLLSEKGQGASGA